MRRILKVVIFSLLVVFIIASVFTVISYVSNKPPLADLNNARETLASVEKELDGKYSLEQMLEAKKMFEQAMSEWKAQNESFFIFRDYSMTREFALKSIAIADTARLKAGTVKNKLIQNVEVQLNETWQIIERFERYYKHLALNRSTLDSYNRGKIKYYEALHDYERSEIKKAQKAIKQAFEDLHRAEKSAYIKLSDFYRNFDEWKKNEKMAYSLSKKGQTIVLVKKMESTCILLKSGKEFRTFQAEFGLNWMGDKMKSGDKATPEGVYKIIEKKRGTKTKYYKALLLDYPNNADKMRFNALIESGGHEKKIKIGGLIEIHGGGGKGIHWTDGCIALENKDMDAVFEICSVGTQVIIIGSGITMKEYLN